MDGAIAGLPDGACAVNDVRPDEFARPRFGLGFATMAWAGLRVTCPWRSRLLGISLPVGGRSRRVITCVPPPTVSVQPIARRADAS
jgi:hypothetical protein